MSGRTLEKARAVVAAAEEDPETYAPLVRKMDQTGRVDRAFKELRQNQFRQRLQAKFDETDDDPECRIIQGDFRDNGTSGDAVKGFQLARGILLMAVLPKIDAIDVTGGTMKAVSKVLQKTTVTSEELEETEQYFVRRGPPSRLKLARVPVFLPGVLILKTLVDFTGAEIGSYLEAVSIGRIFLDCHRTGHLGTLLGRPKLLTREIDPRPATEPGKVVVLRAGVGSGVGSRFMNRRNGPIPRIVRGRRNRDQL